MLKAKSSESHSSPLVGILGAGQLAQMMSVAAHRLGLRTRVAAASDQDPAVAEADEFEILSLENKNQVSAFCEGIDLLLFESELANFSHLQPLVDSQSIHTFPQLSAMQICADKYKQKQLFQKLDIPSPRYIADQANKPLLVSDLENAFPEGCVLKWSRHGYDGRGNFFWRNQPSDDLNALEAFCTEGRKRGAIIYAEQMVTFTAELALVTIHLESKASQFYPLVQTIQRSGVCETVRGPVDHLLAKGADLQRQAEAIASKVAKALPLHGCFAIEFFLDTDGRLLANEIAPRVHNSGHATLDACWGSQFENHLRAALGFPLSATNSDHYFGMINILGPKSFEGPARQPKLRVENAWLYWYGKSVCKPGRKMGHINVLARTSQELDTRMQDIRNDIELWAQSLNEFTDI